MQSIKFAAAAAVLTVALAGCGGGAPDVQLEPRAPAPDPGVVTRDCPVGAVLTALTPDAGWARQGSVFSTTLYDPSITSGNTTHQPRILQVRVTLDGRPVAGCAVQWQPQATPGKPDKDPNGWVFPTAPATDGDGISSAWWTAGSGSHQVLEVDLRRADGSRAAVEISGEARGHRTRANTLYVNWQTADYQKVSVEVTPHSWPPSAYYSAINFEKGYAGILNDILLFSVWDLDGVPPVVVDPGISTCNPFGSEGTGIQCKAAYVPQVDVTYRFELEIAPAPDGQRGYDYSMYFADPRDGQRKKLGTMRQARRVFQSVVIGFVEDFLDDAPSCLENKVWSATFGRARYQGLDGQWVDAKEVWGHPIYNPNHNEVCANYRYERVDDGRFRLTTGGHEVGPPLNLPGSPAIDLR